jgi:dipeptidyl aminopeptidase/acylaminoacyl peptidase
MLGASCLVALPDSEVVAQQTIAVPQPEPVSFHNGDVTLSGTLYLPAGPGPHPAVIAFHSASGPSRDYPTYQHLATELPRAGYAVLLYDRRGSGTSTGDFPSASFEELAADGIIGIRYLTGRREIDRQHIGVWGISQGGWLAPLAATMSRDIAFVVAVSASGVSPAAQMDFAAKYGLEHFRPACQRGEPGLGGEGEPWFEQVFLPGGGDLPPDPAQTKWYLEMDYDPIPVLKRISVPMAFYFGESDRWVPVDESIAKIRAATESNRRVTIRRFAGTDHLMGTGTPDSGGPVSQEYVKALVAWLGEVK